jgi:hypothetical protein
MPTSIREQIRDNLMTTLATISTSSGYANTVTVEARQQWGNAPADRKIVLWQLDPTEEQDGPLGYKQWSQPYAAIAYAVESESSSTAIDERINSLVSDIAKVLMVDPHRGNLAIDTITGVPENIDDESGALAGVVFNFTVRYRHNETDPTSQT